MKTIPDLEAALWLGEFDFTPDNFDWDAGNERKNLKHGVTADEIESIFAQAEYVFAGRIIEPTRDEWRGLILGPTSASRALALIFTRRGEKLRPISCRPMRIEERRSYEAQVKEQA